MARTEAALSRRNSRASAVARAFVLGMALAGLLFAPRAQAEAPASIDRPLLAAEGSASLAPPAPEQTPPPQLFGTIAFRIPLKKAKNWLDVLRRNAAAPIFDEARALKRSVTWGQLRARLEKLPLRDQLREVNLFWNAWPYRSDKEVWCVEDFWATPAEFLARSGDCEDFCIAKYFTLRQLGIPADSMLIVVVRETIRGIAHAVLAVFEGQQVHILDNLSDTVRPMRRVRNYAPQFSVNENGRWLHVKATRKAGPKEKAHGKQQ